MDTTELLKLLGQGGITAALLFVVGKLLWKIGERMITAIDKLGEKIDLHTQADVKALIALTERIQGLESHTAYLATMVKSKTRERLDQLENQLQREHRSTPIHGVPAISSPQYVERERSERVKTPHRGVVYGKRGQWGPKPPGEGNDDDE